MHNLLKGLIFLFAIMILLESCKPRRNKSTSTKDNSAISTTTSNKDVVPTTDDKKATGQNEEPHIMGTPVGNEIIGRWIIEGSAGDVVLEFTHDGKYLWTNSGKQVGNGTYEFDQEHNSLEMSGKGRTEVKIEGNKMTEKANDDITLVYKRL